MEMIDVIKKLKELEGSNTDVAPALESAMKMAGQPVQEGVEITVTGSDAVLSQILKLAGMTGAETHEVTDTGPEIDIEDDANRPYVNSPDEQIAPMDAAVPSGTDLHAEKDSFPATAGGDNPMAVNRPLSLKAALGM